jgi:glycosyltransferase involved in cell wall biosynthesis
MRVLHAPTNIGNQPWTLSRTERKLGINSDVVCNYSTSFNFHADRVLSTYTDKSVRAKWTRLSCGLSAPFKYDVLHYYFGRSLLVWDDYAPKYQEGHWIYFRDLKLAKRLGRRVIFTLQGCDVRMAGKSNAVNRITMCRPNGCTAYGTCIAQLDAARQHFIDNYLPMAERIFYLNPELHHFIPRGEFMPYGNVDIDVVMPAVSEPNSIPRILHAPSNDSIKGTPQIEAALRVLATHYKFEYVPVRGLQHVEAMKLYRSCDLVIDNILCGWYGGFSVEVMAMAKPVVCYIRDEDLAVLPAAMREQLPFLRVSEGTLVDDLARILERRREWPEIGRWSRSFVERWHDPKRISRALLAVYRNSDAAFMLDEI